MRPTRQYPVPTASGDDVRLVVDTIPGLVWSARPDGSAEFFNRRWLEYTGLAPDEALEWGWKVAIHPEDLPGMLEVFDDALKLGRSFEVEGRFRRWDGEFRWFLFRGDPLLDGSGQVVKWYGTNTDLEDRKRAEDALRAAERDVRLIVDSVPGLVWTMTAAGDVELVNRQMLAYFGTPLEELKDWSSFLHPDDRARVVAYWRSTIETGQAYEVEHRLRRADGLYRWFQARGLLLRDPDGHLVRWYNLLTDIDDRKRAEDALRTSEQRFRLVVDSIPGLVVTTTPDGEPELANQQMLQYFGKTLEELKEWAVVVHPDDRELVVATWSHSVETGEPHNIEQRLRRADGVYRWFHVRALPLRDSGGRILRWYSLFIDVDERKRAEEKLRRSEWNLLEAQRLGHSGSWSLDVPSGMVTSSPEMIRVFDPQPGEDYFRPDFFFNRIHPEDRQRVRELFERCVVDKTEYQADYRILRPDGTVRNQHSIGYPILNEAGDLVEFVGTAMDTTEHVQGTAELERALAEIKLLKDQLYRENLALRDEVDRVSMFEEIVGTSPALEAVLSRVIKVALTDSSVLITGETGTGKELIARAIHKRSLRSQRAFVSVNCAALPASLIASELFGYEKGAFTGAGQRRLGRFELANGGTIFLDEVGELPADTQVALLRVLQERDFERVGGTQSIHVDVRVIAATNRDLEAATATGVFRSDLFYRLNVFPIEVPPLRARKDDIVTLLEYFVHRFGRKVGKTFRTIDTRTIELFRSYDWPGNIRELQNVVERSVIVSPDVVFRVDEAWLSRAGRRTSSREPLSGDPLGESPRERQLIEAALAESRGRVSGPHGAAAKLRLPPTTLDSKIKRLRIRKSQFKLA